MYDQDGTRKNVIKQAIYKMYKSHWLMHRIKPFDIEKLYKEYLEMLSTNKNNMYEDGLAIVKDISYEYTFQDFIEENGINGELYVCYDEFLDIEYQDEEIIKDIIFHTFNDKETAQAVFYIYQTDISFDKNGEATFIDVKIQEFVDVVNDYYWCEFVINNKKFSEPSIPDAIKRIIEYKNEIKEQL